MRALMRNRDFFLLGLRSDRMSGGFLSTSDNLTNGSDNREIKLRVIRQTPGEEKFYGIRQ
jgi:hypothetical protein